MKEVENAFVRKVFYKLLDKHGARKEFRRLYLELPTPVKVVRKPTTLLAHLRANNPVLWIDLAFDWSKTPQGVDFWKKIAFEWGVELCDIVGHKSGLMLKEAIQDYVRK